MPEETETPPTEEHHETPKEGGGFFARLRHMDKGKWLMVGIAAATLVVGFLAYRLLKGQAGVSTNSSGALPSDTSALPTSTTPVDFSAPQPQQPPQPTIPVPSQVSPEFANTPPDFNPGLPDDSARYTTPPGPTPPPNIDYLPR